MLSEEVSRNLKAIVLDQIEKLRTRSPEFQEAYDAYVQQYGKDKVNLNEPVNLSGSIDPVVLVLGRNCVVSYLDTSKLLKGSLGSLSLERGEAYIIGRREPQDSKFVAWDTKGRTVELEEYNSRADTIPSRIHGALAYLSNAETLYSDLGSSAGTIVVGQSPIKGGEFVRIYDPGSEKAPSVKFERIFTSTRRTS
jgi:hypothetical protein